METEATHFTTGSQFRLLATGTSSPACSLVRIYPTNGIGEVFELGRRCVTLGRDSACDIQLHDDSVSRRHATIAPCDEGYLIGDLDSTNGVYVNELRVSRRYLVPGDRIRLGNQIFKFLSADHFESQYHELVYKIMTTDGLTQVSNKRHLLEVLERELSRCRRTGRPLSLLLLDLDRFKSINDIYGHLAGDAVLAEFSRRAQSLMRHDEMLARYGGEEFVVLLSDTSLVGANVAAERIRAATAAQPFTTERASIPVTVSIGAVETHGQANETAAELIKRADALLYQAKQHGRNRCAY
jgi:diguanylate cyclase (GGDEF)-like protein